MAEYLLLQADLSLEVSASLVTRAGRSQPGRAGYVNSQILKTVVPYHEEIWELTYPVRSGSLGTAG